MSRTNETRHTEWHEMCKYKCRLDGSVCNNKLRWNDDKCKCECKKFIDKGVCDKGLICNPSNCECECDKSCDVCEYLDHENCKCRKKLVDKLVEERTENAEEVKLAKITLAKEGKNKYKCSSCTLYIVVIFNNFYNYNFVYYKYMNHVKKLMLKKVLLIKQHFIMKLRKWLQMLKA